MKVCAVRDSKLEAFGQPIFVRTIGMAIRSFQDEVNNRESPMHAHVDDYDLYHLGDYDDASGLLIAATPPVKIAVGKEMLQDPS